MIEVEITDDAQDDLKQASQWYENQKAGLGIELLDEFERVLNNIESNPQMYATVRKNVRFASFSRFPYVLLFVLEVDFVVIFAFFHTSRNPKIWLSRLK